MAKGKNGGKSNYRKGKFPKDFPIREESKDKFDKFEKGDARSRNCFAGKANDPMWYAQNPALLRDAASFPYGWPVGNRLELDGGNILDQGSIPGVLAFYVVPSIGPATTENDPVNMAARNIYAYVRHANSGHTNYDAPDLMLYLLAMDSVYSYHSFLKRVYGLARAYTPINRYYPQGVLTAMGVDYDDVMANLAQLRYGINVLQAKFNAMRIPASMSYMARHMWMYTNIYQDGDTDKCQTYFYTPHAFYQYGYDADGSGMLKYVEFMKGFGSGQLRTVKDLIDFGNSLINPILASEDMGIMSGDILKAFGDGNLVTLTPVDTGYMVVPEYNTEVLSQMENLTMIGYPINADITQQGVDPTTNLPHAWITYDPDFQYPIATGDDPNITPNEIDQAALWKPNTMKRIINFHKDDVQAADTMVATRLTNILTPNIDADEETPITKLTAKCSTLGSEFVASAAIFYYAGDGADWKLRSSGYFFSNQRYNQFVALISPTTSTLEVTPQQQAALLTFVRNQDTMSNQRLAQFLLLMERLSIFDWHPMIVPLNTRYSTTVQVNGTQQSTTLSINEPAGFFYDVENYTTMTKHDLERLSEAAILSEFAVTAMGATRTV